MLHLMHRFDCKPDVSRVYKAMRRKDLSDCVVIALEILEENDKAKMCFFKKSGKSTAKSLDHRAKGKTAFCEGDYKVAYVEYNQALLVAPHNSEVMMSVYYHRAELLLKTKNFVACIKDIETCLALNCPDKMVNKLKKMKDEACKHIWMEKYVLEQEKSSFTDQFFKPKGELNPDIPCASSDIEVIMESQKPKVVAAREIPVGTVLALETSFVSSGNICNILLQCHYCLKMSLNLMPCDGCNVAFCDKKCREQSMREGHNVECKIMDLILSEHSSRKLAVLNVLKMRQMCKSWDELITASLNLGDERMRNSSIADIFGSNKFSILNSQDDKHFIYGAMYYNSLYFAYIIQALDTHTSFLPNSPEEKNAAIRAISRIMMHLSLYSTPVQLRQCTRVITQRQICFLEYLNSGIFPFISKLSHSCLPNAYVAAMGRTAALVTCMPIKKGAEITIPYMNHWLDLYPEENMQERAVKILNHYKILCNCNICSGNEILNKQPLNDTQKKAFQRFKADETVKEFSQEINLVFMKTCKTLELLSYAPYSKEYVEVFETFIFCLMHCINCQFRNEIM